MSRVILSERKINFIFWLNNTFQVDKSRCWPLFPSCCLETSGPSFSASFQRTLGLPGLCDPHSMAADLRSWNDLVLHRFKHYSWLRSQLTPSWKSSPVSPAANYLLFLRISTIFIWSSLSLFKKNNLFYFLFLAALSLRCCMGFSLVVVSRGPSSLGWAGFSLQWFLL